jgi:cytochrome c553
VRAGTATNNASEDNEQMRTNVVATTLIGVALLSWVSFAHAADAAAGQAQAAPCAACHGENGISSLAGSANLAGQNERYLFRQLQAIRDNKRPVPLMAGQLDGKSDEDLANLAAHYARLPPVVGQANDDQLTLGTQIYRGGILEKGVAACTACHSPTGQGNAPAGFPHLSGQAADYVIAQLKGYREGVRTTDEDYGGMMRQVASGLTDTEITAVANYIRGLH